MPIASTSRNVGLPIGHEMSSLVSSRESDSPMKVWQRNNETTLQQESDRDMINALARKVELMRRRILGGAGGQAAATNQIKGEYSSTVDSAGGYSLGNIVVISTGSNQGTYAYVNASPSSGAASPWVGGGYWLQLPGGLFSQWM